MSKWGVVAAAASLRRLRVPAAARSTATAAGPRPGKAAGEPLWTTMQTRGRTLARPRFSDGDDEASTAAAARWVAATAARSTNPARRSDQADPSARSTTATPSTATKLRVGSAPAWANPADESQGSVLCTKFTTTPAPLYAWTKRSSSTNCSGSGTSFAHALTARRHAFTTVPPGTSPTGPRRSSSNSAPPPSPPSGPPEREESGGRQRRFYEFSFKIGCLGVGAVALLYHILKYEMEQEVETKLKEKELKDKDKLIVEKQNAINKMDTMIQLTQEEVKKKKRWWFF